MFKVGSFLFTFGIISFFLRYSGRKFIILTWINTWGPQTGKGICIGMIVLGLVFMGIGISKEKI